MSDMASPQFVQVVSLYYPDGIVQKVQRLSCVIMTVKLWFCSTLSSKLYKFITLYSPSPRQYVKLEINIFTGTFLWPVIAPKPQGLLTRPDAAQLDWKCPS